MGEKSRLKKEKRQGELERALGQHPMRKEVLEFLKKRRAPTNEASRLLYLISMMASFLLYRSIGEGAQLPVIRREEEEADRNRVERIGRALGYECHQLNIELKEIMDELVFPMTRNKVLMKPILDKTYESLEGLIPSDHFRQPTEEQIENPEFWGDSLEHYADRKEDYFQVVKKLFALVLDNARSKHDEVLEMVDREKEIEDIRKTYSVDHDDFQKLRRRATDFFRIAFSSHLGIVFQPVRDEVDEKIPDPASNSHPLS